MHAAPRCVRRGPRRRARPLRQRPAAPEEPGRKRRRKRRRPEEPEEAGPPAVGPGRGADGPAGGPAVGHHGVAGGHHGGAARSGALDLPGHPEPDGPELRSVLFG